MKNIAKYKRINNLQKFDIGTIPIDNGYLAPQNNVPIGYATSPAVDMSLLYKGLKQLNVSNIFSRVSTLGLPISSAANIGTFGGKTAFGLTAAGAKAVGGAVMAIPNAISLVGDINAKNEFDGLTGADLKNIANKTTEYINGVGYLNIGAVDQNNILKAAKAKDFEENFNTTMSSVGLGAGIGTAAGSIIPGLGNFAGALIGGGVGLLGSALFGWGNEEEEEQLKKLNNFNRAKSAANELNYSIAASQGLRNNRADDGKNFGESWSANGIIPTLPNGLAGYGESIYDPLTGDAKFINVGKRHVDNVKVNVKDRDVIFGNLKHTYDSGKSGITITPNIQYIPTGKSFAQEAEPVIKELERLNNLKNNKADKTTLEVLNREIEKASRPYRDYLNWLSEELTTVLKKEQMKNNMKLYKNGKPPKDKDDDNTTDVKKDGTLGLSLLSSLPGLISTGVGLNKMHDYAKSVPHAINPYVPNNNTAAALQSLASLKVDPYNQLRQLDDQTRLALYLYTHMPYAPGQQMGMLSNLFNNRLAGAANILTNADLQNNQYKLAYAQALLNAGNEEAERMQQAYTYFGDQYAKTLAAKRRGIESGQADFLSGINSSFGNFFNNLWTQKNIGLYEQYVENEKLKNLVSNNNVNDKPNFNSYKLKFGFPKIFPELPELPEFFTKPSFSNMNG